MEGMLSVGQWLLANGPLAVSGVIGVLSGLIIIFMLIPGDQPEKALRAVVEFLAKFSVRKKDE